MLCIADVDDDVFCCQCRDLRTGVMCSAVFVNTGATVSEGFHRDLRKSHFSSLNYQR